MKGHLMEAKFNFDICFCSGYFYRGESVGKCLLKSRS